MKRINLFALGLESEGGAAAIDVGDTPSNTAVDTDTVVPADAPAQEPAPATDENALAGSDKLEEVRALDAAEDVLEGVSQECFRLSGVPALSLEEEIQANVEMAEAIHGLRVVGDTLPTTTGLVQAINDLDVVAGQLGDLSTLPASTAALLQVTGQAIVAGTDADATQLAPALEDASDKSDRRGVIRRIIDNILAMVKKFWNWLKSFFKASATLAANEEAKMDALKQRLQLTTSVKAPRATRFAPMQIQALVLSEDKFGAQPNDVMQGAIMFQKQFDALLKDVKSEGERLKKIHEDVELGRPLNAHYFNHPPVVSNVFPGRVRLTREFPPVGTASDELELRDIADILKDVRFECEQFLPPDEPEDAAVPDLPTLEKFCAAYFKLNGWRLEQTKAFRHQVEEFDKVIEKLEREIERSRDATRYEDALFRADYLACLIRYQSASLRAVNLSGANYARWMTGYLGEALKRYEALEKAA
jgi:hypothetical protein